MSNRWIVQCFTHREQIAINFIQSNPTPPPELCFTRISPQNVVISNPFVDYSNTMLAILSINEELECSEYFDHTNTRLKPKPCDFIHEARFCTKFTGMYGGRITTTRNCSSRDLGDYCTYVERQGDIRYIRSCVYTCSSDDCNSSYGVRLAIPIMVGAILCLVLLQS
ncbi:hypothetical protein RDWZM_009189 [Blomia tropicalis]|uniref:Protein sleepless n=1 Tax=Blomia tropicalis TaxID=40697 RepID=A0A9Q0M342_BLOTA|nr:hypothetical protein RDWZM_009189 [Blomia tropicalis]